MEQNSAEDFLGIKKGNPPSERALNFAHSLLSEREPFGPVADAENTNSIEAAHELINGMNSSEVSRFIDGMRTQPVRPRRSRAESVHVGEGIFKMGGTIYKVQRAVHGSGHLYAKKLIPSEDPDYKRGHFVFEPGAITRLRPEHALSVTEAAAYGRLYGFCVVCGRTLTDEQSIAAGIGPVCAGRL